MKLKWSERVNWADRNSIPMIGKPGVYTIYLNDEVIYIGMSVARGGLKSRLQQLDKSLRSKWGHSGGNKMVKELGDCREKLSVVVMTVDCDPASNTPDDLRKMGHVAFLEYEAFAQYVETTGNKRPRFNSK